MRNTIGFESEQKSDVFAVPIVMLCGESLFWLLEAGLNVIHIPSEIHVDKEASWCGYASFGSPVTVTTKGLKWDVG